MNRDETVAILRLRWSLTDQKFNDDTVDAWHAALAGHAFDNTRVAVIEAATKTERVNLATVFAELPKLDAPARPPEQCELCGGDGWQTITGWPAHQPRYCAARFATDECWCHMTVPCQCTTGQHNRPIAERIIEANDRELNR